MQRITKMYKFLLVYARPSVLAAKSFSIDGGLMGLLKLSIWLQNLNIWENKCNDYFQEEKVAS